MIKLYRGDCLDWLPTLPDKSIDMFLVDLPYGTSQCKWDTIIPFDKMWKQIKRLRKDETPIVLFGIEPFSSYLRLSNIQEYKYDWIWDTVNKVTNHLNAKKQPMRRHENISVFYKKQCTYNYDICKRDGGYKSRKSKNGQSDVFGKVTGIDYGRQVRGLYPISILEYKGQKTNGRFHETEKPVDLLTQLIKLYSNERDTICDFSMGSGSSGVPCVPLNRNYIGIEKDDLKKKDKHFRTAIQRIIEAGGNNIKVIE